MIKLNDPASTIALHEKHKIITANSWTVLTSEIPRLIQRLHPSCQAQVYTLHQYCPSVFDDQCNPSIKLKGRMAEDLNSDVM